MQIIAYLSLFVTLFNCGVNGANILGVFFYPSPSHHMLGSTLMIELARKGHNVTMLSPFALKENVDNYTHVSTEELLRKGEEVTNTVVKAKKEEIKISMLIQYLMDISRATLNNNNVQNLLKYDNNFDLIIFDSPGSDVMFGLTHRFNAPAILFSPYGDMPLFTEYSGNYYPFSYLPADDLIDLTTFTARLKNILNSVWNKINLGIPYKKKLSDLLTQYFPEAPPMKELYNNIALILLNSHYTYETPRPYTPNVIQIGGFNLVNQKGIQSDLKEWLDDANDGVVLVSYGSKIKGYAFDDEKINIFLNTFAKLKQKVLWKFDVKEIKKIAQIEKLPINVKLLNWIPQKEILDHPNVRVFITHGGMGGVTEAIYGGVPMIGTPFYGDQERNVINMVNYGYGVELDFRNLTQDDLLNGINEILTNPTYAKKIKTASMAFKNQPICPLEKAVYWIEHVIKYKGADHLKPASLKLTIFEQHLFDVVFFLLGIASVLTYISYVIMCLLFRLIFRRR